MPDAALRVRNLRKEYKDVVAVDGLDLEVLARRVLRPARSQRRRQDHHHRDLRGPDRAPIPARWNCSACAGTPTPRELRQRLGIQLQETQLSEKLTVLETVRLFRSFFRKGPAPHEVIALVQLEEKRNSRVGRPLRRTETAPGPGLRPGRRSRFPVPRRAHHRPRPAGPPPAVGPDRALQSTPAAPSCSPPTTWTKPSASATAWPSWITAR